MSQTQPNNLTQNRENSIEQQLKTLYMEQRKREIENKPNQNKTNQNKTQPKQTKTKPNHQVCYNVMFYYLIFIIK